jgi:hypothetical protein
MSISSGNRRPDQPATPPHDQLARFTAMSLTALCARATATTLAWSASALMLVSALISSYWAAGGTGLLDTVGGSIARWGRDGGVGVRLALVAIVVLKLVAAWLPLQALKQPRQATVRRLAWLQAAILTVYGGVQTVTGLAVQAGLIKTGMNADWKALDWHAYLWDPWFLITGLLVWAALLRTHGHPNAPTHHATGRDRV